MTSYRSKNKGVRQGRAVSRAKPSPEPPLIFIDSNEESNWHWSNEFRLMGFSPEVMPLEVGDFKVFAAGKAWPIERKSVPNDLETSFVDGRLSSQVQRAIEADENLIILLEGNLLECRNNFRGLMHALVEAETLGVILDFCQPNDVVLAIHDLRKWLDKEDRSFFRKPVLPLPQKYNYGRKFDGSVTRYERVRTAMTFKGVSEDGAVEWLKRFTLEEVLESPDLLRGVLKGPKGQVENTIRRMKEQLGIVNVVPTVVRVLPEKEETIVFDRRTGN